MVFIFPLPTSTGRSVVNLEGCIISLYVTNASNLLFNRCTVHFDIYNVHTPTNALLIY